MILTYFALLLMTLGAALMSVAALGIVRMPDLFTRMQAATKSGTAGAGFILLGAAFYFSELEVATNALVVVGFLFLTAPVAAHMLARAGYQVGVPLTPGTSPDELKEKFGRGGTTTGGTPHPDGEPVQGGE